MRFAFWSLAVVVVLAPLPFASNRPWAWSLLAVLVALLLAVWAVNLARDRAALAVPLGRVWPLAAAFIALLVLFVVQVAPMTPAAWHHPLWAEAAAVLDRPIAGTISLDPGATITAAMRFATYGAIFWIALQGGRDRDRARSALWLMVLAGFAYSVYGLFVDFSGADSIL